MENIYGLNDRKQSLLMRLKNFGSKSN